jgi:hypothetical protein
MTDVQTLLTRCYALGATFLPLPDGKLKVRAPAPLPESLQAELKRRKPEILAVLRATAWLRSQLATPRHIAALVAEWVGPVDGRSPRQLSLRIDDLMEARWTLGVVPYWGEDGRAWWKLPQRTVQ